MNQKLTKLFNKLNPIKMKKILYLLTFSTLILSSCGIFTKGHSQNRELTVGEGIINISDSLTANYLDYNSLKIKFSADYTSRVQKISLGGTLKIKKDTFIWMSLSPGMGIEAARVLLTPDSVKFINRLKSEYFAGSYDFLQEKYGLELDYYTAQAIFTNELFIYPAKTDKASLSNDFTLKSDSLFHTFTNMIGDSLSHKVNVNKGSYKINSTSAEVKKQNKTFDLNYKDFAMHNGSSFPELIEINANVPSMKRNFLITYNKIYVNKPVKASFKIAKTYNEIKLGK